MNTSSFTPPSLTEEVPRVTDASDLAEPFESSGARRIEWRLVLNIVVLIGFGIIMIKTAGAVTADGLYGNPLHFVGKQMVGIVLGLSLGMALMFLPMKWLKASVMPFYLGVVGLQMLVLSPLGHSANGAQRWIKLGPLNVQPSELAKLALIAALSLYLHRNRGRLHDPAVFLPGMMFPGVLLCFMVLQKDFGTTVILMGLTGMLYFVAGLQWRYVISLGALAFSGLAGLALWEPYRVRRILNFTDPFLDEPGAGFQVIQGWIALATGGLWGSGLGSGIAQTGFVPEAHTDFISSVIGEELGAVGWIFTLCLFAGLMIQGMSVAARSKEMFGMLLAGGISTMFAAQVFINMGVVAGLVPPKGLVLPFLSYGASAVLVHSLAAMILVRMSMETNGQPLGFASLGRLRIPGRKPVEAVSLE